jgi:O-antigen/teichoic acid export membrane protein
MQVVIFGGAVCFDKDIPRLSLLNSSMKTMRDLWAYGMKSMAMMLASRLQVQSMPFVIGSVLGLDMIVFFVMPRRLMEYARGVSTTIGFPLTPYFASFYGRDDHAALRERWLKSSLALQVISNAMPVVLLFCGVPFIGQWLGTEYAATGKWVIYILVIGLAAESLVPNAASLLMAANRHGRMSYLLLFIAGACVPVAIIGAKLWGLVGVAIACSIATVIGSVISLWMACRELQITPVQYFRESTLLLLTPLLILSALMWICGVLLPVNGYIQIILQLLIGGSGYLVAIWLLVLDWEARARVAQRLARAW